MKAINYRLIKKLEEVFEVEPNDLGFPILTNSYHRVTKFFKTMPFIFIVPLSIAGAIILSFLAGSLTIRLASLLQYGF